MAEPWFHLPELPAVGDRATLDGREARHAAGARRLQPGAPLRLFDGAGRVAEAAVERVGQGGRELVVAVRRLEDAPVLAPGRHLICSMPKGERQGVLLSMATQLGITTFTPLHAERTVARGGEKQRARARRIVVEA
jgi:16S rRNA (uracil1498-N3)-methyltransferase